jgi:hypothetical protein
MTTIHQDAFKEILEELEARPIAVNKYRDIAGAGRSQTFGLVNKRCQPVDYSRQCWVRPKLYYHLQQFAAKYVDISWTSITVNQNYRCSPHRDKGNYDESFLVAFGSYTGGDLLIHEGDLSGSHDIYCKPFKTDFSKVLHSVDHFTGNRYSLVFYKLKATKMPKEPLPDGKVVIENGKYVFKRGDKIITVKDGLDHPLKGRTKKETTTLNTSRGDYIVSFE